MSSVAAAADRRPNTIDGRAQSNVSRPSTKLYLTADLGLVVPLDDTGNRLSLELGIARALGTPNLLYALTVGDAQRFD